MARAAAALSAVVTVLVFGSPARPALCATAEGPFANALPTGDAEAAWSQAHARTAPLLEAGRVEEAVEAAGESLRLAENLFGPDDGRVATSLDTLGIAYRFAGRHSDAKVVLTRALELREKHGGVVDPEVGVVLNHLAAVYNDQQAFGQVEALLLRVLEIDERAYGSDHPDVAEDLSNLASVYHAQERWDEADRYYRRALSTWEVLGLDSSKIAAEVMLDYALLLRRSGQTDQAEAMKARAGQVLLGAAEATEAR